jgi:uncharacterized membrane protein
MTTAAEKSSTGLEANVAAALCYIQPIGVVFLFLEQSSAFVRFHAMQSTFLLAAAIVTWIAFSILSGIMIIVPILGWLFSALLWFVLAIGMLIVWVMCLVKALQGERFKLPYLGDLAEQQLSK